MFKCTQRHQHNQMHMLSVYVDAVAGKLVSRMCVSNSQTCPCIFEYIYLSRPDSVLNDMSVYNFQLGLGIRLSERIRYAKKLHLLFLFLHDVQCQLLLCNRLLASQEAGTHVLQPRSTASNCQLWYRKACSVPRGL